MLFLIICEFEFCFALSEPGDILQSDGGQTVFLLSPLWLSG